MVWMLSAMFGFLLMFRLGFFDCFWWVYAIAGLMVVSDGLFWFNVRGGFG